jgi:hypothetical protein
MMRKQRGGLISACDDDGNGFRARRRHGQPPTIAPGGRLHFSCRLFGQISVVAIVLHRNAPALTVAEWFCFQHAFRVSERRARCTKLRDGLTARPCLGGIEAISFSPAKRAAMAILQPACREHRRDHDIRRLYHKVRLGNQNKSSAID